MKQLLATAAILVALSGLATAQTYSTLDRTQEYRMWSAEQMINRIAITIGKNLAACNEGGIWTFQASEKCKEAILKAHPSIISGIREAAASGNEVWWAETVDIVHKLELDTARAEDKAAREQEQAKNEQKRLEGARQHLDSLRWR